MSQRKWNSHSVSAESSILRLSGILLRILRAGTTTGDCSHGVNKRYKDK